MKALRVSRILSNSPGAGVVDDRPPLTKATIATAALALIDSEGLEGFSMRKLGQMLDVKAMSLYHYFQSKEALLDGVVELIQAEIKDVSRGASSKASPPMERVLEGIDAFRTVWRRHPKAFRFFAQQPARTPERIKSAEMFVTSLLESGLDSDAAIFAYRAILSFASGFVLLENESGKPLFTVGDLDREFEVCMEIVLAGIDARLRRHSYKATRAKETALRG